MDRRDFLKGTAALSIAPALLVADNSVAFDLVDYEALAQNRICFSKKVRDYRLVWSLQPQQHIMYSVYGPEWNAWGEWKNLKGYDWEVGWLVNEVKQHPERVVNDIEYCVRNHIGHYNGFPEPQPIQMRHHSWGVGTSICYRPDEWYEFNEKEKNNPLFRVKWFTKQQLRCRISTHT
jgi:hypothetical protein